MTDLQNALYYKKELEVAEAKVATIMKAERKEQARLIDERDALKAEVDNKEEGIHNLCENIDILKAEVARLREKYIKLGDLRYNTVQEITKLKSQVEELKKMNAQQIATGYIKINATLQSQVDRLVKALEPLLAKNEANIGQKGHCRYCGFQKTHRHDCKYIEAKAALEAMKK